MNKIRNRRAKHLLHLLPKRKQQLNDELAYIKAKLPLDEQPELPLMLDGDLLKQRLLAEQAAPATYKAHSFQWKQLAAAACCLVFIVGLGWPQLSSMMMDRAAPETASMERSMEPEAMALDLDEELAVTAKAEMRQLQMITYPAAAETTMEQLQQLYHELGDEDIYVLTPDGSQYTVLRLLINEEYHSIAILCGAAEVSYDTGCYILHDTDNDLTVKLHEETLDVIE